MGRSAIGLLRRLVVALGVGAVVTAATYGLSETQYNGPAGAGLAATVAALVMALFIFFLQEETQGVAHERLVDRLEAQDELLRELAVKTPPSVADAAALTEDQRAAIQQRYGQDMIAEAWKIGEGRGNRPRLVKLRDGRLVSVYSGGRRGGTYVHEIASAPPSP